MHDKIYSFAKVVWHATYIRCRDRFHDWKYRKYWSEHRVCNGHEYADKTFYIVRRREVYTGLFSDFIAYVYKTKLALDKGYIPIVDMQTSQNMYLKEEQIGKVNAWEYFFRQPGGYSLENTLKAKNVIWGSGYTEELFPYMDVKYLLDEKSGFSLYQQIAQQYFNLSVEAQEMVEHFFDSVLKGHKVLGVLCRGTDYTSNKPTGHPIQPDIEQMFAKLDDVMEKYQCTKIFLGTEDKEIYSRFLEKYGEKVTTSRKQFITYNGENAIGKLIQENVKDLKAEGMEYLVTIALLARCDCFVGGHTSGTVGVMLMNDRFEYKYIFDLGVYP